MKQKLMKNKKQNQQKRNKMYTIEEFDANKSKVLRYVLYKKRSKQEVKNKFAGSIESELL